MNKKLFFVITSIVATVCFVQSCKNNATTQVSEERIPDVVSYNFDIRPILSDKCYACHGPDANKRKADLRLDIPENVYKALKDNPKAHALVPGKPEQSEVFLRIAARDTSVLMPPPASNLKLNEREISLIKKWISQGAKYEKHWAFVPPKSPSLPEVKNKQWTKNEIDYFVLSKQEKKGVTPNPEADKERLLKRVSLDLNGLPPTIEMMDGFLADNAPNAYEKVVDQLLKSPAYGEKMAVHWMDVARYADSHGYQDDNLRTQWPWRDWVIHAFNTNMPYDKFVTWQVAGDMQPNASNEQILATGFFRNHKYTEEGGVIPEEYRIEYLLDKTKTFGKGILGVTIECAQCHDHKYDPFSQKDYYRLLAFFNNTKEVGFEGDVSVSKPAKAPLLKLSDNDVRMALPFINKTDKDT